MAPKNLRTVKDSQEYNQIRTSKTVFVDFYADWCGPCKMISPVFEQLAEEFVDDEETVFLKVNVDDAPEIASAEQIRAMPTFKAYRKGQLLWEVVGADSNKLTQSIKMSMSK